MRDVIQKYLVVIAIFIFFLSGCVPKEQVVPEDSVSDAASETLEGEPTRESTEITGLEEKEESAKPSAAAGQAVDQRIPIISPMLPQEYDNALGEYVRVGTCRINECVNINNNCVGEGLRTSSRYICDPSPSDDDPLVPAGGGGIPADFNFWFYFFNPAIQRRILSGFHLLMTFMRASNVLSASNNSMLSCS